MKYLALVSQPLLACGKTPPAKNVTTIKKDSVVVDSSSKHVTGPETVAPEISGVYHVKNNHIDMDSLYKRFMIYYDGNLEYQSDTIYVEKDYTAEMITWGRWYFPKEGDQS